MRSNEKAVQTRRSAQAERTRQNILTAAREEFAALGLKGARTASIAEQAGINPHAIFRYFGSKEGLYLEAVRTLFEDNWYLSERDRLVSLDPIDAIEEIMDYKMDRALKNPIYFKFMSDMSVNGSDYIQDDIVTRGYYAEMVATVDAILRKGEAADIFRKVDPLDLSMTLSSAVVAPITARAFYNVSPEDQERGRAALARWYDSFKEMVFLGIRKK